MERKRERIEVEDRYQLEHKQYFDESGRVFDLRALTDTHFVADVSSEMKGGN